MAVDLSAEALAERLTMAGLEVEAVEAHGRYERFVAGKIVELGPHPQADRLSLCTVDAGARGHLRVVSGAPHLEAGARVVLALPGARLSDGRLVESVEIRGVLSQAALVSEREIGVSEDGSGVMRLSDDAVAGADLASVLGTADTVIEVAVTPNRGDCLSILGIARELCALTGARLRNRPGRFVEKAPRAAERIRVEIRDPDLCSRYVARIVTGVKIGPSPLWMRTRLEALGLRPINNVVDVTNYVMLERGQPLHAFDLARLAGPRIVVQRPAGAQIFVTLDGIERSLAADDLVIADSEKAVALAGIMGGAGSAVEPDTQDVLIESACFAPTVIRRTSRRLGLRSESSLRFERSVDIEGVPAAADRAVELLLRIAGGQAAAGAVDVYPSPSKPAEVLVRSERVNRLLGASLAVSEIGQCLRRVSASVKAAGRGGFLCRPPTFRSDLFREADFIEEVARLAGYDRIPETLSPAPVGGARERPERLLERRIRGFLTAEGMAEMICPRFLSSSWNQQVRGLAPAGVRSVEILNPLSTDASEMRHSLLPNLLAAARRNRHQGEAWLRVFEIGNVFWADAGGRIAEHAIVGGLLCGPVPDRGTLHEKREESYGDVKGVAEALLDGLRVPRVAWRREGVPAHLHPGKSAVVFSEDVALGVVGGVHPSVARAADLAGDLWAFEIDFGKLGSCVLPHFKFRPLPKHPGVVRDLAIVAEEKLEAQAVLDAIARCPDLLVEDVRLFDVYRGAPLPAGKKSLAYSIAYRAADRTLTDEEVNRLHQRLVEAVTSQLGVVLRG